MNTVPRIHREALERCLLGTAVGDALCLPYEGLPPRRLRRILPPSLSHRFFLKRGMVSDDTDHTVFVAQALARHPHDPEAFARTLAWRLRCWLLCLPAGIGLATLRSILRLWVGVPVTRSGVFSAGNGAAMRSALIGVMHAQDGDLRRRFVQASSRITHSDPKAEYGARAMADLAAFLVREGRTPNLAELEQVLGAAGEGVEWEELVALTCSACRSGNLSSAVTEAGRTRGVSGYIYHTLPVAITGWYLHLGDYRATLESVVRLGGDTDTVAAMAGALAGISAGPSGIPADWIDGIIDRPHGPTYLSALAATLAGEATCSTRFSWWLFPRGILFTLMVLGHVFRRLLPPY